VRPTRAKPTLLPRKFPILFRQPAAATMVGRSQTAGRPVPPKRSVFGSSAENTSW
jgi:hypothetical protein